MKLNVVLTLLGLTKYKKTKAVFVKKFKDTQKGVPRFGKINLMKCDDFRMHSCTYCNTKEQGRVLNTFAFSFRCWFIYLFLVFFPLACLCILKHYFSDRKKLNSKMRNKKENASTKK